MKTSKQTYESLFEKWCLSNKVTSLEQLQELMLLEEFKNSASEPVVVHLNEQKVNTLYEAAVIADEYVLTHKTVFPSSRQSKRKFFNTEQAEKKTYSVPREIVDKGHKVDSKHASNKRVCFYCLDPGHIISDCKAWKQKNTAGKSKSVAFAQAVSTPKTVLCQLRVQGMNPFSLLVRFTFVPTFWVSLSQF